MSDNILFFTVRSLIKLDQQGLDLCFSGLINFYTKNKEIKLITQIESLLKEQVDLCGAGITYFDYCLLDNGLTFFDDQYGIEIRKNTSSVYKIIHSIFEGKNVKVYYPENEDIPIMYIEFVGKNEQFYRELCDTIIYNAKEMGLEINCRTSFGFRNISFEYFALINTNKCLFKVAPGLLNGVNYMILITILKLTSDKLEDFYE